MFSRFGLGIMGTLALMYVMAMAFGAGDITEYGVISGVDVQCAVPDEEVWVCEPRSK